MEAFALNQFSKQDKNENTICNSDLYPSTMVNDLFSSKCEDESMDRINECFEGLKLDSYIESNEGKSEHLVGTINNIITSLCIVIVKPLSANILLYVGTPLFLLHADLRAGKSKYALLGYIDDIFGSVGEPMYSVAMKCDPTDISNINAQVYYFPNHPNTLHMNVQHIVDKKSKVGKYKIKTQRLYHVT